MPNTNFYKVYRHPGRTDPKLRKWLEDLSRRGFRGGTILNHRAMLTSRHGRAKILSSSALSILLLFGWLSSVSVVSGVWARMLSFWNEVLGIGGYVTQIHYQIGGFYHFRAPYFHVSSATPDDLVIMIGWVVTAIFFVASFLIPRMHLPLIYVVRVVLFFQLCAQVFFTFVPLRFPYGAAGYVHGLLIAGLGLIALVPILLGFTYFIFDFSLLRKVGLALLIILYMALFIPLQFAAHAFILHHASLLVLPLLFFVFGLPFNVMTFIALYSWGASWKNELYERDVPRKVRRHVR